MLLKKKYLFFLSCELFTFNLCVVAWVGLQLGRSQLGPSLAMCPMASCHLSHVFDPTNERHLLVILGGWGLVINARLASHPHHLPNATCSCTIFRYYFFMVMVHISDSVCSQVFLICGDCNQAAILFLSMESWGWFFYPSSISDAIWPPNSNL